MESSKESGSGNPASAPDGQANSDARSNPAASSADVAPHTVGHNQGPGTPPSEATDAGVQPPAPDPWDGLVSTVPTGLYCYGQPGHDEGVRLAKSESRPPTARELMSAETPVYVDEEFERFGYV